MKAKVFLFFFCLFLCFVSYAQKDTSRIVLTPKQEGRFISQNALFLGFHFGGSRMLNKMEGAYDFFKNGGSLGQCYGISIEKGLAKNFFFSSRLSMMEVWDKRSYEIGPFTGEGSNAFWASQASIHVGYRVIGPKNYNYLNVAVGLENGFALQDRGTSSISGLTITGPALKEGDLYSYTASHELNKNWYSAISLELSKDFKIFKGFYMSITYSTQFGLRRFFVSDINYYLFGSQKAKPTRSFMDGTQQQFLLGIKYKF